MREREMGLVGEQMGIMPGTDKHTTQRRSVFIFVAFSCISAVNPVTDLTLFFVELFTIFRCRTFPVLPIIGPLDKIRKCEIAGLKFE